MTSPALSVQGLTFQYSSGSSPALVDVERSLRPGEMVLVAGPSGCGKSTLIKCLNGLIPRSYKGELGGRVELFGEPTDGLPLESISARVGTVLQDPDKQLVAATVRADIAFGLENEGLPRQDIHERMGTVASELALESVLGRATAALSGGERQKVALAGVLAMRPAVMLLDEPLANLDPATAMDLLRFLRRQTQSGLAVLVVEHRVEDVLEVGPDRVIYMEQGRVRYDGDVDGFLDVADPEAVKLPFAAIAARHRGRPSSAAPASVASPNTKEPETLVAYADVSYRYSAQDPLALKGVSASLHSPERVAVLGPNGSGKSTLLKLALGLMKPSSGEVVVAGAPTTRQSVAQLARHLSYVFQSPRQMLFANSVREELAFAPRNQGMSGAAADEVAGKALRLVGLDQVEGIWERSPYALSFGQQKRLAIAAALTMSPRAIVVDEPSAGQDYGQAAVFLSEIGRLAGLESVYFITHDVDLALLYSDRCLLIREGSLEGDGPPMEVLADLDRLSRFRLRPTSLLAANLSLLRPGEAPMDAGQLATRLQKPG